MLHTFRLPLLFLLAFAVSSCARMTTVMREYDPTNSRSIAIDAKQRVVLSGSPKVERQVNGSSTITTATPVICAEPSPDALSAIAASTGLALSNADREYVTNFALSESAGSIGLRTQSIQLMRDAMYRLCEGYLSGAIDPVGFETLHRRFQSSMVAILAIEQLTGAVRAPTVALSGSAVVGAAEIVAKYTELTDKSRQAIPAAQKSVEDATAAFNAAKTSRETLENEAATLKAELGGATTSPPADKAKLDRFNSLNNTLIPNAKKAEGERQASLAAATAALENLQSQLSYYDAARRAALSGGGNTSTIAVVNLPSDTSRSDAAMTNVATAVSTIVASTLGLNFTRELCTSILGRSVTTMVNLAEKSALTSCYEYLSASVKYTTQLATALETANKMPAASAEQIAAKDAAMEHIVDLSRLSPDGNGSFLMNFTGISADEVADQVLERLDSR